MNDQLDFESHISEKIKQKEYLGYFVDHLITWI